MTNQKHSRETLKEVYKQSAQNWLSESCRVKYAPKIRCVNKKTTKRDYIN